MAGELLAQRFDIEWEGQLISASRPSPSGLVVIWATEFVGWWPRWTTEDLPSTVGAAPGARVQEPMFPTVTGLEAADPDDVAAFRDLVDVAGGWGDLSWWDPATNVRYTVDARLSTVDPRPGPTQTAPTLVDVSWFVPRPDQIALVTP